MSSFRPLPTDNAKKGAKSDSIFYRPQSIMKEQYANERKKQLEKQKELLKGIKPINNRFNTNRRSIKLAPVGRIALGGNKNNNNKFSKFNKLKNNKVDTTSQMHLIKKYKKQFSRSQYEDTDNSRLPPGTMECVLIKRDQGTFRSFVGHFSGSKAPEFKKSKITSIRAKDLQSQIEEIQFDTKLPSKKREEMIAKCM